MEESREEENTSEVEKCEGKKGRDRVIGKNGGKSNGRIGKMEARQETGGKK